MPGNTEATPMIDGAKYHICPGLIQRKHANLNAIKAFTKQVFYCFIYCFQVQDYERDQEILSGVDGVESEKVYPFEYCWEKIQQGESKEGGGVTPAKPIPGHSKSKSNKSSRSPRNSLPKSPSSSSLSKSPKSPKSPSGPSLAGLTNEELQHLKDSVSQNESETDGKMAKKASVVKFEDFPPLN